MQSILRAKLARGFSARPSWRGRVQSVAKLSIASRHSRDEQVRIGPINCDKILSGGSPRIQSL